MAGNAKGKLRALYIMQMLQDETDDNHGLSMAAILSRLADLDITADRKTVYTDLDTLREFGLRIEKAQRNPVEYYLANRDFTLDELTLMVDAVQSCRFITQKQSEGISRKIRRFATDRQREKLERRIHVDNRVRIRNDSVLAHIDVIHEAMHAKKKIVFTYWKIGLDGKPHASHDGAAYHVSPMRVTFSESRYYLTGWSDEHEAVREYRVDRMRNLCVSEQKAHRCDEMKNYEYHVRDSQFFGRFDGPVVNVTLRVEEEIMPAVFDYFEKDAVVNVREDGAANVRVSVRISPQFYGWIAGMDGLVTIEQPKRIASDYKDYLKKLLSAQQQ